MKTIKVTPQKIIHGFQAVLSDVSKKTLQAGINTVNIQAAQTRKNAKANIADKFILRNKFTENSIVYTPCTKSTKNYSNIISTVGALQRADYLERQEVGGIKTPKTGTRLAIPTTHARGGSNSNTIRKRFRMGQMQSVRRGHKFNSYRANLVAAAFVAAQKKLVLHYYKQIYIIDHFKKNGNSISFDKKMIYNKNYTKTKTPAKPWLEPATEKPAAEGQLIFNQQMDILFS